MSPATTHARLPKILKLAALVTVLAPVVVACSSAGGGSGVPDVKRAAFTSKEFGVAVSPRVSTAKNPPRGGGRQMVGKPYTVRGSVYTPMENPEGYVATGEASWYGNDFHGRRTANGEIFSANAITGAHPTLPLPSYVRVTNLQNGRSMVVRVNDRGPYMPGRIMDLSYRTAEILGYSHHGKGQVQVNYIGPAPLEGDDTKMLLASIDRTTQMEQGTTRFALNAPGASDPLSQIIGLFGYADGAAGEATGALAAADAVAAGAPVLENVMADPDAATRKIRLELGSFSDLAESKRVAEAFAMLGAVDEDVIRLSGKDATRLTVTHLKPGVAREDVLALTRELGLRHAVLY